MLRGQSLGEENEAAGRELPGDEDASSPASAGSAWGEELVVGDEGPPAHALGCEIGELGEAVHGKSAYHVEVIERPRLDEAFD